MSREPGEIRARHALLEVSGIGAATFNAVLKAGATASTVMETPERFQPPLKPSQVRSVREFTAWSAVDADIGEAERLGASRLWLDDPDYPPLLKEITPPPPVLYCRTETESPFAGPAVAIVGTRDPSSYGEEMAYELGRDLAQAGVTVVSGFALGIDTAAHRGALEAGGRTIAVLGCGLGVDYPKRTDGLREQIIRSGAVLSEFTVTTAPRPEFFRQRNRVISGLSLGTVVVEGTLESGALVTARHALEQNRLVFAVPGQARQQRSAGPHQLLREGAILAESADDILAQIAPMASDRRLRRTLAAGKGTKEQPSAEAKNDGVNPFAGDELTARLWELLTESPVHADVLAEKSGLDAARTMSLLLQMELTGKVVQSAGMRFSRMKRGSGR